MISVTGVSYRVWKCDKSFFYFNVPFHGQLKVGVVAVKRYLFMIFSCGSLCITFFYCSESGNIVMNWLWCRVGEVSLYNARYLNPGRMEGVKKGRKW